MFWRRRRIELVSVGDEIDDTCAVLTMIARYHGREVDTQAVLGYLEQVAEDPELDRSALDIINAARELGLVAEGLQIEHPLGFSQVSYPCVGHVTTGKHHGPAFVVLEQRDGLRLSIIDPYADRASESIDDFFGRSSGVVIVFEPGQPLPTAVLRRPTT